MKKAMMAVIALTLITGVAMSTDNKKPAPKKATKQVCDTKACKDKQSCTKTCKPVACTKKC